LVKDDILKGENNRSKFHSLTEYQELITIRYTFPGALNFTQVNWGTKFLVAAFFVDVWISWFKFPN